MHVGAVAAWSSTSPTHAKLVVGSGQTDMQQAGPYWTIHADQLPDSAKQAVAQLQVVRHGRPWCRTALHHMISAGLAALCAQGLMSCGTLGDGTPLHWQLIRGAAVSAPQVSRLDMAGSMHPRPPPQVWRPCCSTADPVVGTTRGVCMCSGHVPSREVRPLSFTRWDRLLTVGLWLCGRGVKSRVSPRWCSRTCLCSR